MSFIHMQMNPNFHADPGSKKVGTFWRTGRATESSYSWLEMPKLIFNIVGFWQAVSACTPVSLPTWQRFLPKKCLRESDELWLKLLFAAKFEQTMSDCARQETNADEGYSVTHFRFCLCVCLCFSAVNNRWLTKWGTNNRWLTKWINAVGFATLLDTVVINPLTRELFQVICMYKF